VRSKNAVAVDCAAPIFQVNKHELAGVKASVPFKHSAGYDASACPRLALIANHAVPAANLLM